MADATIGLLRVILTANTAEFDSAMKKASDSAKSWSKDLGTIGQQATAIGRTLTTAITLPLVALGAGAVKMASDFESSFAGVRKTVDATEPEFAQLAQGLRDMAKEIPINVNELNKVAEAAGQLGIKKDDILGFTRTMADLGETTNLTADEAATATAQIQNIFGAAGKDVDRFGATLVALGNAGASTEKSIIDMGLRIAGAGNQVGLTQAQVLAFASSLSSVGINAEAGGSAISRVFLKINDAVASGGAKLDEFARIAGMSSAQFKQAFETDAAGATTAFIAGLGRLKGEGENVNATLEGVVGKNIILKDTLLRAAGAGDILTDQLKLANTAWQENTALTEEAAKRYQTFESQVKLLWAQIRDLGIEVGTALLPTLRDLITVAKPVVAGLAELAQWFGSLPQGVRTTALAVGALVAALGPAIYLFGQVALGAQAITTAFAAQGIATRALTALMTTATAQTGLFGMALGALGSAAAIAATAFAAWKLGGWIGEITGATDAVGKMTAKMGEWIGLLPEGTAAQYNASRAAAAATTSFTDLGKSQGEVASTAVAALPPVQKLGAAIRQSATATEEHTESTKKAKKEIELLTGAVTVADPVWVQFKTVLQDGSVALRNIADGLNENGTLITRSAEEIAEASRATAEWVRQNGMLKGSIEQVSPVLITAGQETKSFFQNVFGSATELGKGISAIFQAAFVGGGGALGAVKSFATQTLSTMLGMIPGVGPFISGFAGPIVAMISSLTRRFSDFFRRIFGGASAEEMAGRGVVADFEEQLEGALTAAQQAEAGTDAWKRTVIALRDAYLAAGRTEEEALADAKRLWESSKQGAEEAARVIEEIRKKMQGLTSEEHVIEVTVRANKEGDFIPGEDQESNIGFATGTMGRFGSWFKNFGSKFPTALHGVEAVLRPQDALPFAHAVMAGLQPAGAGSTTNNNSSSVNVLPVIMGSGLSARDIGRQAAQHLASSGLANDEGGITSSIEAVIDNWMRTYTRA